MIESTPPHQNYGYYEIPFFIHRKHTFLNPNNIVGGGGGEGKIGHVSLKAQFLKNNAL